MESSYIHPPAEERLATLALWSIRGVGPATVATLRSQFGSAAAAVGAGSEILGALRADARTDFERDPDLPGRAARIVERCAELGARIIYRGDPEWPARLVDMKGAQPECLFVRGRLGEGRRVALVGTRQADAYGQKVALSLGKGLATLGLTVVSGGAQGIDSHCHTGALNGAGRTWAVLGAGFDHLYPSVNRPLFERMVTSGGALVTEHPPAHEVKEGNFPRRNKLVAALSEVVVVIRGAADSGAMLTAHNAHQIGRKLLAVPGQVGERLSEGPNRLLRTGWALACGEAEDVLRCMGMAPPLEEVPTRTEIDGGRAQVGQPVVPAPMPALEADLLPVWQALGSQPIHFDDLLAAAGVSAPLLASALTQLEVKGLATQKPGKLFLRS